MVNCLVEDTKKEGMMNAIDLHRVTDLKVIEKRFEADEKSDGFTSHEIVVKTDGKEFCIILYSKDGIKWFKELDEITSDLEAYEGEPEIVRVCVERLKNLVPLKEV